MMTRARNNGNVERECQAKLEKWAQRIIAERQVVEEYRATQIKQKIEVEKECQAKLEQWAQEIRATRQGREEYRATQIKQKAIDEAEYRKRIKTEAYFLWEADGKPVDKDDYYWAKATDKIERQKISNIPIIYQPYYWIEKNVLEPVEAWIDRQAFFTILGRLGNLAVVVAIVTFVFGENVRRNNQVFTAWQTITSADGKSGSGGRIEALEFLNSQPLRFPWIGFTKEYWFVNKHNKTCKKGWWWGLRWERQPLAGLSAPNAYLVGIHLCGANLIGANLSRANLIGADLSETNLIGADLSETNLRGADLRIADLSEADLFGADLFVADLFGADLFGADLIVTDLIVANLSEANLSEANLSEADLFGANLSEANLSRANLSRANLSRANLSRANLSEVENLTFQQIKSACFWEQAIYKVEWNEEKQTYVVTEPDNTNYIEELKKDKSSYPQELVNCSVWIR